MGPYQSGAYQIVVLSRGIGMSFFAMPLAQT